jgi:hypothetical protein
MDLLFTSPSHFLFLLSLSSRRLLLFSQCHVPTCMLFIHCISLYVFLYMQASARITNLFKNFSTQRG